MTKLLRKKLNAVEKVHWTGPGKQQREKKVKKWMSERRQKRRMVMWKKVLGYDVMEDNGNIIRATKSDINGSTVPAAIYRWSNRQHCWIQCQPTVAAFRAGIYRGTYTVM